MAIAVSPMSINLSALVPALQQVTESLQSLVSVLSAQAQAGGASAGVAALGGGGTSTAGGCGCCGANDAAAGAGDIGQALPSASISGGGGDAGGAAAAPIAPAAPATSEPKQADKAQKTASATSSKGQQLVDLAKQQLGKPYVYGAAGPGSFDCSGLILFAAKQLGINLPRTAAEQATAGKPVDKADLQPGDLVYFQNPGESKIGHIGMYVGDGKYIHAPQPGDSVKIGSLSDSYAAKTYRGARRIV